MFAEFAYICGKICVYLREKILTRNNMNNAIVLTNGLFKTSDAKTAHGLIRGTERFTIVGLIDGPDTAGEDAGTLLDNKKRNIPVFANLQEALNALKAVNYLIIGVATPGGVIPADMFAIIEEAIQSKLSVVNGLHQHLSDDEALVELAKQNGVDLIDVRKPKKRKDLHFWTGEIYNVKPPIVALMGTDCALGKRTTARLLKQACEKEGLNAQMIYTGQTGWLQGGQYGFVLDSTLNDFVSGELEHAIVSCAKETNADIIFIEGQAALRNPSGPCGLEFLISGQAKQVVLVHAPKRVYYDNEKHWGKIPGIASEIEIIEKFDSKVIAVALNTEGCSREEAFKLQRQFAKQLNLPVLLPLEEGVQSILPALKELIQQKAAGHHP